MSSGVKSLFDTAQQMLNEGADIETILLYLRQNGSDKLDSIKIVKTIKNISLGEAKGIVELSKTWEDRHEADSKFHDGLVKALDYAEKEEQS